jgi:hypothetical protein
MRQSRDRRTGEFELVSHTWHFSLFDDIRATDADVQKNTVAFANNSLPCTRGTRVAVKTWRQQAPERKYFHSLCMSKAPYLRDPIFVRFSFYANVCFCMAWWHADCARPGRAACLTARCATISIPFI